MIPDYLDDYEDGDPIELEEYIKTSNIWKEK